MDPLVVAVFVLVYAGMILGEVPRLAPDRSGIALIASGRLTLDEAASAIDLPTMALLLASSSRIPASCSRWPRACRTSCRTCPR